MSLPAAGKTGGDDYEAALMDDAAEKLREQYEKIS